MNPERKSCFFIGHREASDKIYAELKAAVEHHIAEFGVTEFVVGHYGGFDRLAARAVMEAKRSHPEVTLLMLLPYHPSVQRVDVPDFFDGTYYPEGMESVPRRLAIVRANRCMADQCDYLIAYVWHPASNAKNLLEYARRRQKKGELSITLIDGEKNELSGGSG